MTRKTSFLLPFLIFAVASGAAYSADNYATEDYVDEQYIDIVDYVDSKNRTLKNTMTSNDNQLFENQEVLRDMLNARDADDNWIELNTNAKLAIPAINELKAILDTKANADDVLTADSLTELNEAVAALELGKADATDLESLQNALDSLGDKYATDAELTAQINAVKAMIPSMSDYVLRSDLATVATTGSYESLTDKPTIPSTDDLATKDELNAKQNLINAENMLSSDFVSGLATVATSGQYADLQGKPDIPSIEGLATEEALTNLQSTLQAAIDEKQEKGSYADAEELEALQETVQSLQNGAVDKETVENLQTSVEAIAADYAKKSELTSTEQSLRAAINGVKDLIPTNVSAFNNDAGYQTAGDVSTAIDTATENLATKTELNAKQNVINADNMLSSEYVSGLADVATTGSYESLTDKPTIPSTENLATKDELNAKQNVINAENMLSSEYVSGLADVATTGSYESLTDKPTIPSTENLVTKDELNDLQNALQAKINEMHESGDYATAESLLAVSESLATLKGDVYTKAQVDKMIADVISGGQINLEGYAKQADLNTLSGIVDAIKLKTDVLGALAYKDTVATTDIDAKAVTTAQIAGGTPAEGDSMMLMSTNKDGTVTWTSVRIY